MFTVCPKCALTLVVTAADLRVAQGYVRCGRCSNVFNAIAALTEERHPVPPAPSQAGAGSRQSSITPSTSTATTSIIRKAPSLEKEPPHDPLSATGESEAIYAEPEFAPGEQNNDGELFVEAPPPAELTRSPSGPAKSSASSRSSGSTSQARPTDAGTRSRESGLAPAAQERPQASDSLQPSRPGLATTEANRQPAPAAPLSSSPQNTTATPSASPGANTSEDLDAIPDDALEFNPNATDVMQVFVEAAPPKKIDLREITGAHRSLGAEPTQAPGQEEKPQPAPKSGRDPEDAQLEDELRALAARLDEQDDEPSSPAVADDVAVRFSGSPCNTADALDRTALSQRRSARASDVISEPPDEDGADAAAAELAPPSPRRGRQIAWIAGSLVLLLLLGAQVIHRNRHDLATHPRLNQPLTRLYAWLDVPLVPRWNLASYDVRQLGASTGGSGNLTVRASLKNAATHALPLPLLRITVQDRYGNRIATRDVPPQGYVPGTLPEGALLGAGQRIDAEMTFKDPGRDAVGFEIDACLPAPGGGISCANDAQPR